MRTKIIIYEIIKKYENEMIIYEIIKKYENEMIIYEYKNNNVCFNLLCFQLYCFLNDSRIRRIRLECC